MKQTFLHQKIKQIIKEEIEMLRENKDKILVQGEELWVSYLPGAGTTTNIKRKSYITDKQGDSHYDWLVKDIVKWSESNKPMKKNKKGKVYKLPHYSYSQARNLNSYQAVPPSEYDIWGGDIKPDNYMYMVIVPQKYTVVSFFKNKNEALSWLKN